MVATQPAQTCMHCSEAVDLQGNCTFQERHWSHAAAPVECSARYDTAAAATLLIMCHVQVHSGPEADNQ